MVVFAALVMISMAFPDLGFEALGAKQVFGAVWVATWAALFFAVDRITARHLAGDEPAESKWFLVQASAGALALVALAGSIAR